MLGSVFSGRRDYTKVTKRAAVQSYPYKSDMVGFNTRFSLFELEQKEKFGTPLTPEEDQYLSYIRSLD